MDKHQKALEAFFTEKLKKHGAQLACPPGAELVEILGEVDGDLDGDGQDEIAVSAISCLAGSVPDLHAVLKMGPGGKLAEMPFAKEDPSRTFPHMNPKANARGPLVDSIEKGRLVMAQGIYHDSDATCCPTGGARRYYYRWNGKALELQDVIDSSELPDPSSPSRDHKEVLDRSIEHGRRADVDAALEQVFLRESGQRRCKKLVRACLPEP